MFQDRPTYLKINLDAVLDNYTNIKKSLGGKEVIAVVKADAYGSGARVLVKYLYSNGVKHFAVSTLEEALEIKEVAPDAFILVLGIINPMNINYAVGHSLAITCPSKEWLKEVVERLDDINGKLKLHLKIDSGMSRIGISSKEEAEAVNKLLNHEKIELEGMFTHYANSDADNDEYDKYQRERFAYLSSFITHKPKYVHHENSAATMRYANENNDFDMARVGISLYGQYASDEIGKISDTKLRNVSSLISAISHVKEVEAGTKIGYGCTYETTDKEYIATVAIGYRDGLLRRSQGWSVIINGEKCEIVGRVCMDQIMIRCQSRPKIGDEVLFYGEHNGQELSVEEFAKYQNTITYEIFCGIGERVPRRYFVNNREVEIGNVR
ncbi:MAG: alanine racemase [Gemella sp.]|nr:alanine racemase [Gemella sp.]